MGGAGLLQTGPVSMPAPPRFDDETVPRDALRAALEWLEQTVPDCRARRSAGSVRRVRGSLSAEVRLQSSTYSRRGAGVWVTPYLNVQDKDFGRWRAAHPDRTWRSGDYVWSSGSIGPGVQLYGPLEGYISLPELRDRIEREWLPVLDMFDSTGGLAEKLDVSHTPTFNVVEWLAFRDDLAAARRLLERYLDAHPVVRTILDEGRAAGLPEPGTPIRNEIRERWAPTLETLGVLAPGEPLPGVPPEVLPEPVDGRAEVLGILSSFGRVTEV